ncbi:MAG: diguanylate cyclase [Firmicutes bacterium]|nr:diguanylate cyclase [Bacillota bacterium]
MFTRKSLLAGIFLSFTLLAHSKAAHAAYTEQDLLVSAATLDLDFSGSIEDELIRQNARMRRAEKITGLGSWELYLPAGTFTVSEGAMRILGWPGTGYTFGESGALISPEYRALREQALNELVRDGKPYDIEFPIQRLPDGEIVYLHSMAEYDPASETVFGTILDITEWKMAEAELKAAKRRNMQLFTGFGLAQLIVILLLWANVRRRKRSEMELQRNLTHNAGLLRLLQYNPDTVEELMKRALHESMTLTQSASGYVFSYDGKHRLLTLRTSSEDGFEEQRTYPLEKADIWQEPIHLESPVVKNQPVRSEIFDRTFDNLMALPVFDRGEIAGLIALGNKPDNYNEMDVKRVELGASNIWGMMERKRGELALKQEKERLQAILLSVGDGVIATNEKEQIEFINEAAQRLTGWSEKDALGVPLDDVYRTVEESALAEAHDPVQAAFHQSTNGDQADRAVLLAKDGKIKHVADSYAPVRDETGQRSGGVLVFRDITQERIRTREIEYLSYHDQLTGLYNRRFLENALRNFETSKHLPLSIVMADLDGLRLVNDTLGHAVGDRLLRKAAQVIQIHCHGLGTAARWGGDEFLMALPNTTAAEAEALVAKMKTALTMEKVESMLVSMSFGLASKTSPQEKMSEVFKAAENNMYRAKLLQSPGLRGETINALMGALFEKNPREEQHSQRVSELAQNIGLALGLNDAKLNKLRLIGLFHDIGKIAVDERILNKPGPLADHEWEEIRRHPEVGYRLLNAVHSMSDIAQSVLAHHERWDGTGYPKGLKQDAIPLEARIIGVVDAFDAMTSYRPYKRALTKREAVQELKKNAGTQFDPIIAGVFIRTLNGRLK